MSWRAWCGQNGYRSFSFVFFRGRVSEVDGVHGGGTACGGFAGVEGIVSCVHVRHARRARGFGQAGELESVQAGAYLILFCATVAGLLSLGASVLDVIKARFRGHQHLLKGFNRCWCPRRRALWWSTGSARIEWRLGGRTIVAKRCVGGGTFECWHEREDVLAGRAYAERKRELRYISRRRSDSEEVVEVLTRQEFADRRRHPDREARPARARLSRPDGAPEGKIDFVQLFYEGI